MNDQNGKAINTGNIYAYVLLTDMAERCIVLKRDINHLESLYIAL